MEELVKALIDKMGQEEFNAAIGNCTETRTEMYAKFRGKIPDDPWGGSPVVADLVTIWLLCRFIDAYETFEIGTWIGTTARTMNWAAACTVHTCDTRDMYVLSDGHIYFYNFKSTDMLKQINVGKSKVDFGFVDANLAVQDGYLIHELFRDNYLCVAVHDLHLHNGQDNVKIIFEGVGRRRSLRLFSPSKQDIQHKCVMGVIMEEELACELL